ncbi:hypothetical protein WJX72_005926 [[Myrmecia] bisecta]|uniref:Protein kinase domain-containing protein n=1 Tax=[Myrmecia] bisecta TaxID=41462 RepID=A0AAW1P5Z2_9CHLO
MVAKLCQLSASKASLLRRACSREAGLQSIHSLAPSREHCPTFYHRGGPWEDHPVEYFRADVTDPVSCVLRHHLQTRAVWRVPSIASLTQGEVCWRARQQLRGTAGVIRVIALHDMTTGMLKSVVVMSCRGSLTMEDEHEQPPLVDIWNAAAGDTAAAERVRAVSEPLKATAVALLSRVELFCAPRCIRSFICSNGIWTFLGYYDKPGHMRLSQAFKYNSHHPTIRQGVHFISRRALTVVTVGQPEPQSVVTVCPPEPAAEVATPSMDLELVQRAAKFHPDLVEAVLGHGMTGDVFKYRFSSGDQAAVKLVARQSDLVKHLVHEADVYLTLRSLWGAQTPALLAVGQGRAGFVLATELLAGRHIDLRRPEDRGLLPCARTALAAVHGHGVAHGDL